MKRKQKKTSKKRGAVILWAVEIVVVILLAYVLAVFFGQSRTNIGQSMDVTISGGDKVLLNTLNYDLSDPKRGDVVAFKPGESKSSHSYIKRVIGLPGETIQIKDGMIYINDELYLEQRDYPVINSPGMASEPITLGVDEYFVLGDNRNNSKDSRYEDVGNISRDRLIGRAFIRIWPLSDFGLLKHQ